MDEALYRRAIEARDKLSSSLVDAAMPEPLRAQASLLRASCQDVARRLASDLDGKLAIQDVGEFLAAAEAFLEEHGSESNSDDVERAGLTSE